MLGQKNSVHYFFRIKSITNTFLFEEKVILVFEYYPKVILEEEK